MLLLMTDFNYMFLELNHQFLFIYKNENDFITSDNTFNENIISSLLSL